MGSGVVGSLCSGCLCPGCCCCCGWMPLWGYPW
jgi:hypothetical protein